MIKVTHESIWERDFEQQNNSENGNNANNQVWIVLKLIHESQIVW